MEEGFVLLLVIEGVDVESDEKRTGIYRVLYSSAAWTRRAVVASSLAEWPASAINSNWASGQTLCKSQAEVAGQTTS